MIEASMKIKTGKCDQCGSLGSLVKSRELKKCRTCVPELWNKVAEMEKERWLQGL
tara:strand:- start:1218 stop:1382 length:165 start_codon:yes stop_codon:yes gene_type:complete